jgi:MFS family permease
VHLAPHYLSLWLPGTLIVGLGIGLTFPVLSAAAVSSLQPERFSVGSAVNQTARQIGGALGVALLVVILGNPKNAARSLENFHHLWLFVACMALSAGVISLALRRRPSPNLIESRDTVLEAQGVEEMLDAEIAVPLRLDDVIQRPSK